MVISATQQQRVAALALKASLAQGTASTAVAALAVKGLGIGKPSLLVAAEALKVLIAREQRLPEIAVAAVALKVLVSPMLLRAHDGNTVSVLHPDGVWRTPHLTRT